MFYPSQAEEIDKDDPTPRVHRPQVVYNHFVEVPNGRPSANLPPLHFPSSSTGAAAGNTSAAQPNVSGIGKRPRDTTAVDDTSLLGGFSLSDISAIAPHNKSVHHVDVPPIALGRPNPSSGRPSGNGPSGRPSTTISR